MANPAVATLQLVAAVANGVAQAQAVAGAGNLTLNGSLVTGGVAIFDVARRVVMASTGADGALVFTITGTDRYGNAISEKLTGVTATPVYTQQDFASVKQIASSGAAAGNITAGTNGVASTAWIVDNIYATQFQLSVAVAILSGAANYTVEHTYDDPNWQPIPPGTTNEEGSNVPPMAWADATLVNKAVNGETYFNDPIYAHRLTINSGTGLVKMQSIQTGITS